MRHQAYRTSIPSGYRLQRKDSRIDNGFRRGLVFKNARSTPFSSRAEPEQAPDALLPGNRSSDARNSCTHLHIGIPHPNRLLVCELSTHILGRISHHQHIKHTAQIACAGQDRDFALRVRPNLRSIRPSQGVQAQRVQSTSI